MSKNSKRWLVMGFFFTLVLSGCKCSDAQIDIMELFNDNPIAGEVIDTLLPTFTFHNSESCEPDDYTIHITDNSEWGWSAYKDNPDDTPTYTLDNPLYPGKEYMWNVKAHKDSYGDSHFSDPTFFYTGPICSGETLVAPDLQDPGPAAWVDGEQVFTWTYNGGCLPLSYEIQFSRDAAFTDIYLTATTADPYAQHLLMAFPDCSSLFWRVRAFDGSSMGPWSDSLDFHYILSDGCYQWNYLSDDFAWINSRVYIDACDQTGFISTWTSTLNSGCMADGMYIVGDGTTYSGTLKDVVFDLGAGPCPSVGLDQKTGNSSAKFGVLTPGTYCVTVSRDQTVDNYGPISMMDGIWTNPRVNQILAEETIEFGPGIHDYDATFVWDEPDRPFLTFPLDFTYACKLGPEKVCPTYDFAMEGDFIPILGRDTDSDYKRTVLNGMLCYILLPDAYMDERLAELGGSLMAADLEFFPRPDPCPKPETKPDPGSKPSCSDYATATECRVHITDGCTWEFNSERCVGP